MLLNLFASLLSLEVSAFPKVKVSVDDTLVSLHLTAAETLIPPAHQAKVSLNLASETLNCQLDTQIETAENGSASAVFGAETDVSGCGENVIFEEFRNLIALSQFSSLVIKLQLIIEDENATQPEPVQFADYELVNYEQIPHQVAVKHDENGLQFYVPQQLSAAEVKFQTAIGEVKLKTIPLHFLGFVNFQFTDFVLVDVEVTQEQFAQIIGGFETGLFLVFTETDQQIFVNQLLSKDVEPGTPEDNAVLPYVEVSSSESVFLQIISHDSFALAPEMIAGDFVINIKVDENTSCILTQTVVVAHPFTVAFQQDGLDESCVASVTNLLQGVVSDVTFILNYDAEMIEFPDIRGIGSLQNLVFTNPFKQEVENVTTTLLQIFAINNIDGNIFVNFANKRFHLIPEQKSVFGNYLLQKDSFGNENGTMTDEQFMLLLNCYQNGNVSFDNGQKKIFVDNSKFHIISDSLPEDALLPRVQVDIENAAVVFQLFDVGALIPNEVLVSFSISIQSSILEEACVIGGSGLNFHPLKYQIDSDTFQPENQLCTFDSLKATLQSSSLVSFFATQQYPFKQLEINFPDSHLPQVSASYLTVSLLSDDKIQLFVNQSVITEVKSFNFKSKLENLSMSHFSSDGNGLYFITKEALTQNDQPISIEQFAQIKSGFPFGLFQPQINGISLIMDNSRTPIIPPADKEEGYFLPYVKVDTTDTFSIEYHDVFAIIPNEILVSTLFMIITNDYVQCNISSQNIIMKHPLSTIITDDSSFICNQTSVTMEMLKEYFNNENVIEVDASIIWNEYNNLFYLPDIYLPKKQRNFVTIEPNSTSIRLFINNNDNIQLQEDDVIIIQSDPILGNFTFKTQPRLLNGVIYLNAEDLLKFPENISIDDAKFTEIFSQIQSGKFRLIINDRKYKIDNRFIIKIEDPLPEEGFLLPYGVVSLDQEIITLEIHDVAAVISNLVSLTAVLHIGKKTPDQYYQCKLSINSLMSHPLTLKLTEKNLPKQTDLCNITFLEVVDTLKGKNLNSAYIQIVHSSQQFFVPDLRLPLTDAVTVYGSLEIKGNGFRLFVNNSKPSELAENDKIYINYILLEQNKKFVFKQTPRIFGGYFIISQETLVFDDGSELTLDDFTRFKKQLDYGGFQVLVNQNQPLILDNSKVPVIPDPVPVPGYYMPFAEILASNENISINVTDVFAQLPDFYQYEVFFQINDNCVLKSYGFVQHPTMQTVFKLEKYNSTGSCQIAFSTLVQLFSDGSYNSFIGVMEVFETMKQSIKIIDIHTQSYHKNYITIQFQNASALTIFANNTDLPLMNPENETFQIYLSDYINITSPISSFSGIYTITTKNLIWSNGTEFGSISFASLLTALHTGHIQFLHAKQQLVIDNSKKLENLIQHTVLDFTLPLLKWSYVDALKIKFDYIDTYAKLRLFEQYNFELVVESIDLNLTIRSNFLNAQNNSFEYTGSDVSQLQQVLKKNGTVLHAKVFDQYMKNVVLRFIDLWFDENVTSSSVSLNFTFNYLELFVNNDKYQTGNLFIITTAENYTLPETVQFVNGYYMLTAEHILDSFGKQITDEELETIINNLQLGDIQFLIEESKLQVNNNRIVKIPESPYTIDRPPNATVSVLNNNGVQVVINDTYPVFGNLINVKVKLSFGRNLENYSLEQYVLMMHPLTIIFNSSHTSSSFEVIVKDLLETDLKYFEIQILNELDLSVDKNLYITDIALPSFQINSVYLESNDFKEIIVLIMTNEPLLTQETLVFQTAIGRLKCINVTKMRKSKNIVYPQKEKAQANVGFVMNEYNVFFESNMSEITHQDFIQMVVGYRAGQFVILFKEKPLIIDTTNKPEPPTPPPEPEPEPPGGLNLPLILGVLCGVVVAAILVSIIIVVLIRRKRFHEDVSYPRNKKSGKVGKEQGIAYI